LYHNGVEVGASRYNGIARETLHKELGIGCCATTPGHDTYPWHGRLDEIAIFNHALTAEQVRQLYLGPVDKPLASPSATSVGNRSAE
jgi:hypothetical protein